MSTSDEEPYSTIFASLKHPIRRRILRMLSKQPMSFMEMVEVLGVSNSFLTYHLENLGELLGKTEDGKYKLSSFGEAANATMIKVEDIPTTAPHHSTRIKASGFRGRSAATALGIICILLIAGLGGTLAYYTMATNNKQGELNSANNIICQLNTTIARQKEAITQLNTTVTNLQDQNGNLQTWLDGNLTLINKTQMWLSENVTAYNLLQDEVSNIHIWGTRNSTVWVNNETVEYPRYVGPLILEDNETVSLIEFPGWGFFVPSAGYVSVMFSSNSTQTRVAVSYYSNDTINQLGFDVGSNGIIVFPVSPSTTYAIFLYNPLDEPSACTVTITYHY
jgi:DNA-binding transcriptional ArsR family regulator/uncharacterized coiled-coil protein SlyX